MHVVCVVPLYPPYSRVGAWLSTHECLRGLVAANHQVTVVAHMAGRPTYVHDGVTVLNGAKHVAASVAAADLVVTHAGDSRDTHERAFDAGRATVVMVHGAIAPAAEARFLRRPPTVTVANAQATAATIVWPGRIEVVHPPVWPDEHATEPGGEVTQVNLSAAKGGYVFWQLVRLLPERRFLGIYGAYGDQVQGWWWNASTSRPVRNMRSVWARTRVLLMPSEKETWGRVGIEAMCAGIPVLAHPTPGLVESLGDAGIFCDRDDLAAWVRALDRLDDPQRYQQASQLALRRAYSFDPTGDVQRFTQMCETIMHDKLQ